MYIYPFAVTSKLKECLLRTCNKWLLWYLKLQTTFNLNLNCISHLTASTWIFAVTKLHLHLNLNLNLNSTM